MIIVSQDRDRIVNINNITQIYITEDEERTAYFIRVETTCETYEDLGKYYTESRVREVLQEIINKYLDYVEIRNYNGDISQICNIPKVYKIPEE